MPTIEGFDSSDPKKVAELMDSISDGFPIEPDQFTLTNEAGETTEYLYKKGRKPVEVV